MEFKSYKNQVLAAMKDCKHEFCQGIGTLTVAEVQSITPVGVYTGGKVGGNLKKSIVAEVIPGDLGINIGANETAPYAETIEKGLNNHKAQPYLEPGSMNAIPKITNVAKQIYKRKMGG